MSFEFLKIDSELLQTSLQTHNQFFLETSFYRNSMHPNMTYGLYSFHSFFIVVVDFLSYVWSFILFKK
jgi:hypothetical protein